MLSEVVEEIYSYRELGPNWDGDDAEETDPAVIERAVSLLLELNVKFEDVWIDPGVAPSPDGGVDLSWDTGERWTMLILNPGEELLEVVWQMNGSEPHYQKMDVPAGIERVRWALTGE